MKKQTCKIYLLSGEIHSGKTTFLKNFAQNNPDINGFLSPIIGGKRYFEEIQSGKKFPMEQPDGKYKIGRFSFDKNVFNKISGIFKSMLNEDYKFLILDEIGPLEVRQNEGFHELIMTILNTEVAPKILLFVVRDYLLNEFLEKYNFENIKILSVNSFESGTVNLPIGLVLAGGESSRMQQDKAFITYHGIPQYQHVKKLLNYFCEKVYVSVNEKQYNSGRFSNENLLKDDDEFTNHGPMSALLTVTHSAKNNPIFYAACDYPRLNAEILFKLIKNRSSNYDAVCYIENDRPEPMIAVLEKQAEPLMHRFFCEGKDSIYRFLQTVNTNFVDCSDCDFLLNINTSEDFEKYIKTTGKDL